MEFEKFVAALTKEMVDRELPLWIKVYILDLLACSIAKMKEAVD